jgi:rare lipoprotein A
MLVRVLVACVIATLMWSTTALAFPTTYYGVGDGYAGGVTASGDIMDPTGFTAAHPFYPMGTDLTVCWEGCVDVTVNDVGETLDLTPAAAEAIGMLDEGRVDAEVIPH